MERIVIRKGRRGDAKEFVGLAVALAKFEHLDPPSDAGRKRLVEDVFEKKRISLFVAAEGNKLLGYALYFYTYSSFLAKPSLYLEDLFVLEEHRKRGVGFALFKRCVDEAVAKGCGRMEWAVLTWNEKALQFYEKLGARRLTEWYTYRLDEKSLGTIKP
ncbi:MAG: GNAT family N-acetyltransferase [Thaumarchaeota archaeon]|nr:GNAT family N-acetyltransferase [Nitrososphaerota archaeon]